MYKRMFLLLLVALLFCSPAFASVGIQKDGTPEGAATTLNFTNGDAYSTNGSTFNLPVSLDLITTGLNKGGATEVVTDITALASSWSLYYVYVATRTLTLADGIPGQIAVFIGKGGTDTGTTTLTATTKTGWTSAAIVDIKDTITLLYVDDTYGWIVAGSDSLTVTQ